MNGYMILIDSNQQKKFSFFVSFMNKKELDGIN